MMIETNNSVVRQYNNDILSHFATFQAKLQEKRDSMSAIGAASSAAVALSSTPPSPTSLDDSEAAQAVAMIADEVQAAPVSMSAVHSGLDPNRVARLLGLLD